MLTLLTEIMVIKRVTEWNRYRGSISPARAKIERAGSVWNFQCSVNA
jgi:hypothetical protein